MTATGELCILHRTILKWENKPGDGYVTVSCRPGCPKHSPAKANPKRTKK